MAMVDKLDAMTAYVTEFKLQELMISAPLYGKCRDIAEKFVVTLH